MSENQTLSPPWNGIIIKFQYVTTLKSIQISTQGILVLYNEVKCFPIQIMQEILKKKKNTAI